MGLSAQIALPGAIKNTGDSRALFLKVFSGEVIQQFQYNNIMRGLITTRTIPFGKSAQFPVLGRAYAVTHTPGVNILDASNTANTSLDPVASGTARPLTNKIPHNERIIYVDNKLIASEMVSDVDELLNHYDVRSKYSDELGQALSAVYDRTALLALVVAARIRSTDGALAGATGDGYALEPGGGYNGDGGCLGVGSTPTGQSITDALFAAAQRFDELNIPRAGRYCVLTPAAFWAIIKDPSLYIVTQTQTGTPTTATFQRASAGATPATINGSGAAGFSNPATMFGAASFTQGTIDSIAGIRILMSNNVPTADYTSTSFWSGLPSASNGNTYAINCGSTRTTAGQTWGVVFHTSAVGALMVRDISSEMQWYPEYQGTLLLSKYLAGMSWLRPSSAIELCSNQKTTGA